MLQLNQIGQIALTVSDIRRSEDFYGAKLGLRPLFNFGNITFFDCAGVRLIDTPGFPDFIKVEAGPAVLALDWIKAEVKDLDWVFFSPSMMLGPGERTGKFRLGKDDLLVDAEGKSAISYEDLSVAILDELEKPAHHRERMTVGY